MERLNQRKSATTGGLPARSRLASRMLRWAAVLAIPLFLASCASFRQAILRNFEKSRKDFRKPSEPSLKRPVVLKAVARHLMVAPRTEYVWLWDKPGGSRARAMRLRKVPSGTTGNIVSFDSESISHELWNSLNLENYRRRPIGWVNVATRHGSGWVRTDFVEPR